MLSCNNCGLVEILRYSFSNLKSLSSLSLVRNNISYIALEAFSKNLNLVYLDLSENLIGMNTKSITFLESLQEFICTHCSFTNISEIFFKNLPNLRVVNLNDNNISSIHVNAFEQNYNLEYLDLTNNKLHSFSFEMIQQHLGNIIKLSIDNNPLIPSFNLTLFKKYYVSNEMRFNFISQNKFENDLFDIDSPDDCMFRNVKENNIEIKSLQNRNIVNIAKFKLKNSYFFNQSCIKSLSIYDSNEFKFPINDIFLHQSTIDEFQCFECGIDEIYPETFNEMISIEKIVLHKTSLEKINTKLFDNTKLRTLAIEYNTNLTSINRNAVLGLKYLKSFSLDYNPKLSFERNTAFLVSDSLEEFSCILCNISHIDELSFSMLPNLKIIYMDFDKFNCINSSAFRQNKLLNVNNIRICERSHCISIFLLFVLFVYLSSFCIYYYVSEYYR